MKYDYLVVGAGLYGAVFAYEAKKKGKTCLVIDKRDHVRIFTISMYISTVHIFSIHQIRRYGNMLISLQNLITILTHQLQDIRTNYTIFHST